jgi:hypothetical protein
VPDHEAQVGQHRLELGAAMTRQDQLDGLAGQQAAVEGVNLALGFSGQQLARALDAQPYVGRDLPQRGATQTRVERLSALLGSQRGRRSHGFHLTDFKSNVPSMGDPA